jgi:hypothetical protein
MTADRDLFRNVVWALALLGVGACSIGGTHLFSTAPRPAELAGLWVDSVKTTPVDSSLWVLAPDGADRTLRIRVIRAADGTSHIDRHETNYGSWYLSGSLADTAHRALCFQQRARNGASCVRFQLDTVVSGARPRRRLIILGYQGNHHSGNRVLLERVPGPPDRICMRVIRTAHTVIRTR